MSWPSHLAEDVRFAHAAARAAVDGLHGLADELDGHATDRATALADQHGFVGGHRREVDRVTGLLGDRCAELARRLRSEARAIEAAAERAAADQRSLERRRAAWLASTTVAG